MDTLEEAAICIRSIASPRGTGMRHTEGYRNAWLRPDSCNRATFAVEGKYRLRNPTVEISKTADMYVEEIIATVKPIEDFQSVISKCLWELN